MFLIEEILLKMVNNIFTRLLKILNIPHTEQYANESFRLQPYRNTMFGLMLLLNKYKIPNECVQFTDKNTISNDLTPMIIALNGRFIILNQITSKTIIMVAVYITSYHSRKSSIAQMSLRKTKRIPKTGFKITPGLSITYVVDRLFTLIFSTFAEINMYHNENEES